MSEQDSDALRLGALSSQKAAAVDTESATTVFRARHRDGSWRWLETSSATPYRAPDGNIHTVSFARDITQRKLAEAATVESEIRFRTLAENASDLITEVDSTGRWGSISPSCRHLLGREPEELMGRSLRDIQNPKSLPADDRDALLAAFSKLSPGEASSGVEWRFQLPDGSWRWFEAKARWDLS